MGSLCSLERCQGRDAISLLHRSSTAAASRPNSSLSCCQEALAQTNIDSCQNPWAQLWCWSWVVYRYWGERRIIIPVILFVLSINLYASKDAKSGSSQVPTWVNWNNYTADFRSMSIFLENRDQSGWRDVGTKVSDFVGTCCNMFDCEYMSILFH